jgi:hypothetical protein
MIFHALDGYIFACLDTLRFQHLREGTFSLFADQSVFYMNEDE